MIHALPRSRTWLASSLALHGALFAAGLWGGVGGVPSRPALVSGQDRPLALSEQLEASEPVTEEVEPPPHPLVDVLAPLPPLVLEPETPPTMDEADDVLPTLPLLEDPPEDEPRLDLSPAFAVARAEARAPRRVPVPPPPPDPVERAPATRPVAPSAPAAAAPGTRSPGRASALRRPDPPPLTSMRQLRTRATALLLLTLDATGHVSDVRVERGSGWPELDEHARVWVLAHWLFAAPGMAVRTRVPVHFDPPTG